MKLPIRKYYFLIVILFPCIGFSQINFHNSQFQTYTFNKEANSVANQLKSSVYIQQIGTQNYVEISTVNSELNTQVFQNGYNNYFESISKNVLENEVIIQTGNNNYIKQNSFFSNNNVNSQMTQNGNNLSFQSFGENSISSRMIISQYGNSGNMLIFNR